MHQALVASRADVLLVSPLRERLALPFKVAQAVHNAFSTRRYSRQREPVILRGYARQIARAAARVRPDIILAPSSIPLALHDSGVPTVIWTDSAYAEMLDYYPSFSNLSTRHREICDRMEAAALQRPHSSSTHRTGRRSRRRSITGCPPRSSPSSRSGRT